MTADGPLGLPAAYATGFLLGNGNFVVTDLASVARPGVAQVTLRFEDGSTTVCRQFGMANPAIGLVAIHVAEPKTDVGGLTLSTAAPTAKGGVPAVAIGWKWGEQIDLTIGRLTNGVAGEELAERLKVALPAGPPAFLVFLNPTIEMAPGAPILDSEGNVAGILIDMAGSKKTLAVPARCLRAALLAAGARLKPFSQLPKPVWPTVVQELAGEPASPGGFAATVRAVKMRSRCRKCRGTGNVIVRKLVGYNRVGGLSRPVYREQSRTCPVCHGESVVFGKGLYAYFARMAEGAVRLLASPATSDGARKAAVTNGRGLLEALGRVGRRYRDELVAQGAADLAQTDGGFPRGAIVYAQLGGEVEGPDGTYRLLTPHRSATVLAVRSDRLRRSLIEDDGDKAGEPVEGDWLILAGLADGMVTLKGRLSVHLRPFGWTWGPSLGPRPATAPPSKRTGSKRGPKKGEPSFFGL